MINTAFQCVFVLVQLNESDAHSATQLDHVPACCVNREPCVAHCCRSSAVLLWVLFAAQRTSMHLCCHAMAAGLTLYPCAAGECCSPTPPSG